MASVGDDHDTRLCRGYQTRGISREEYRCPAKIDVSSTQSCSERVMRYRSEVLSAMWDKTKDRQLMSEKIKARMWIDQPMIFDVIDQTDGFSLGEARSRRLYTRRDISLVFRVL